MIISYNAPLSLSLSLSLYFHKTLVEDLICFLLGLGANPNASQLDFGLWEAHSLVFKARYIGTFWVDDSASNKALDIVSDKSRWNHTTPWGSYWNGVHRRLTSSDDYTVCDALHPEVLTPFLLHGVDVNALPSARGMRGRIVLSEQSSDLHISSIEFRVVMSPLAMLDVLLPHDEVRRPADGWLYPGDKGNEGCRELLRKHCQIFRKLLRDREAQPLHRVNDVGCSQINDDGGGSHYFSLSHSRSLTLGASLSTFSIERYKYGKAIFLDRKAASTVHEDVKRFVDEVCKRLAQEYPSIPRNSSGSQQ